MRIKRLCFMFLIMDKGKNMLADRTVIRNNHVIGDLMKTVKKIDCSDRTQSPISNALPYSDLIPCIYLKHT